MNFFTTLSEKLGFKPKENDEEREEDELEDDEEQDAVSYTHLTLPTKA